MVRSVRRRDAETRAEQNRSSVKFGRLGVDSAMSVQLAVALEERLGIALPRT